MMILKKIGILLLCWFMLSCGSNNEVTNSCPDPNDVECIDKGNESNEGMGTGGLIGGIIGGVLAIGAIAGGTGDDGGGGNGNGGNGDDPSTTTTVTTTTAPPTTSGAAKDITLTGFVATGAAVANASLSITDFNNQTVTFTGNTTTGADGSYSITIAESAFPLTITATPIGGTALSSLAFTTSATVHLNPLTTETVSQLVEQSLNNLNSSDFIAQGTTIVNKVFGTGVNFVAFYSDSGFKAGTSGTSADVLMDALGRFANKNSQTTSAYIKQILSDNLNALLSDPSFQVDTIIALASKSQPNNIDHQNEIGSVLGNHEKKGEIQSSQNTIAIWLDSIDTTSQANSSNALKAFLEKSVEGFALSSAFIAKIVELVGDEIEAQAASSNLTNEVVAYAQEFVDQGGDPLDSNYQRPPKSLTNIIDELNNDQTAPTVSLELSKTGPVNQDTQLIITADFSENLRDSTIPQISIEGADSLANTSMIKVKHNQYKYVHTVGDGNGNATIKILSFTDLAGNTTDSSAGVDFELDNTDPLVTITTDALAYKSITETTSILEFSIEEANTNTTTVYLDETVLSINSGEHLQGLSFGVHAIRVSHVDKAGNRGDAITKFTVLDPAAPQLQVDTPIPEFTVDSTPSFIFSSSETGTISSSGDCSIEKITPVQGGGIIIYTVDFQALSNGKYSNCEVTLTSDNDRSTTLPLRPFTIDTVNPEITGDTTLVINNQTPAYSFTSNEAGTIIVAGASECGTSNIEAKVGSNSITFQQLEEGTYVCTIQVEDPAGNVSNELTLAITIDLQKPIITGSTEAIFTNNTSPSYSFTSTEAGTILYLNPSCNSGTTEAQTDSNQITFNTLEETNYECQIRIQDAAGNASEVHTIPITVDTTLPAISITSPGDGHVLKEAPTLIFSVADSNLGTADIVTVDAVPVEKISGETLDSLAEGNHTVSVIHVDKADNSNTDSVVFTIDTTNPTVNITSWNDGNFANTSTPILTFTVDDSHPGSTNVVRVDDQIVEKESGDALDSLSEMAHTISVTHTDQAGNTGTHSTTITIDTTKPIISISSPESGSTLSSSTPLLEFSIADTNKGTNEIRVDGTVVNKLSGENLDSLDDGEHTVTVTHVDLAGNSSSQTSTFTIASGRNVTANTVRSASNAPQTVSQSQFSSQASNENAPPKKANESIAPPNDTTLASNKTVIVTREILKTSGDTWVLYSPIQEDITEPNLLSQVPSPGQTGVPITTEIIVDFDEVIAIETVTPNNFYMVHQGNRIEGRIGFENNNQQIRFIPNQHLNGNSQYTITLGHDIQDLVGNSLSAISINNEWSFTTQANPGDVLDFKLGPHDTLFEKGSSVGSSLVSSVTDETLKLFTIVDPTVYPIKMPQESIIELQLNNSKVFSQEHFVLALQNSQGNHIKIEFNGMHIDFEAQQIAAQEVSLSYFSETYQFFYILPEIDFTSELFLSGGNLVIKVAALVEKLYHETGILFPFTNKNVYLMDLFSKSLTFNIKGNQRYRRAIGCFSFAESELLSQEYCTKVIEARLAK